MAARFGLKFRLFRWIARSSNWFERKFTAAGRLLLLLLVVATIFGLDPRQTNSYQLAAVLAALMLCATLLSAVWRARVSGERHLPRYVTVGEPAEYRIDLVNRGQSWLRDIAVRDVLTTIYPSLEDDGTATTAVRARRSNWFDRKIGFVAWLHRLRLKRGATIEPALTAPLPPARAISVRQTITAQRRGVITFAALELRRVEPLGLLRAYRRLPLPGKLIALPKRYRVPTLDWPSRRYFHRGGMNLANSVGDSQEFIGLRDYRPGDPLRQIHWKSFAKLGQPIVREYQDEYFDHHALVFDPTGAAEDAEIFEAAVAVTASFVQAKHPNDSLLDLVMIGAEAWHLTGGRGINNIAHLLEYLAVIKPAQTGNPNALFDRAAEKLANCSTLIFVCCAWGDAQQRFVRSVQSAGVSTLALRIVWQRDDAPDHLQLSVDRLEQQLAAIDARVLQHAASASG